MLWSYTTSTGLKVFTDLVDLTVVTVAIPYLFSACAQLTYLVSRRRRVQGWLLARDLTIAGASVLFSMWVTFAAGYQAVYQALVIVLAGLVLYAFVNAAVSGSDLDRVLPSAANRHQSVNNGRGNVDELQRPESEVGRLRQAIVHRPGLEFVPPDPAEHRGAAVRRRHVGEEGQGRARRLRRGAAGQGRARCTTTGSCSARPSSCPRAGPSSSTGSAHRRDPRADPGRPRAEAVR